MYGKFPWLLSRLPVCATSSPSPVWQLCALTVRFPSLAFAQPLKNPGAATPKRPRHGGLPPAECWPAGCAAGAARRPGRRGAPGRGLEAAAQRCDGGRQGGLRYVVPQGKFLSVMRAVMGVPEGWSGRSGVRRRAGVGARAGPRAPGSRRTGCVHGKVRAPLRSAWTCFCCVARRRPWAPRAPGAVGAVAKPILYDGLPPVRGECFGAYGRHAWPSRGLVAVQALVPDRRG